MELSADIIEAHKRLSTCSIHFLEFVKKNPECLKRSNFRRLFEMNDEVISLQPWPTFINRKTKKEMAAVSIKIFDLVKTIPERIFENNPQKMSRYYEMSEDIIKMQLDGMNPHSIGNLLARGDFIFSPSGLKCLEYNVSANIGGWQIAIWETLYLQIPVILEFLKKHQVKLLNKNLLATLLEHITGAALNKFNHRINRLNAVIIFPGYIEPSEKNNLESYLNQLYKEALRSKDINLEGEVIFCDYPHLSIVGHQVMFKNKSVHILIEMYNGIVPPEIMDIFKKGDLLLFNGPLTKMMSSKLNLALLSENQDSDIFNHEEKEIIQEYIPRTRKITSKSFPNDTREVSMEDYILSNKDELVIKSSMDFSGQGVVVGRCTSVDQWHKAVKKAIQKRDWVVQEYIDSYPYLYQAGREGSSEHKAVWGFFVFGSYYAGAWLRIRELSGNADNSGIINSYLGAEESVVFEVDE